MKNVNNNLNPERFNELLFDVGLGPPFSWNPIGLNNASWKYATARQVSTYRWDSYLFNIGKVIIFTAYLILTKIRWRTKPCCSLVWRFFMVNYSCVIIIRFNFSPVARWQICQKCYSGNKYYQWLKICLFIWPIFIITSATSLVIVVKNVMSSSSFSLIVFFSKSYPLGAHFRETWP